MAGRGKATGASVETTFLNLVHVRDGKVVQLVMYPNRERGLADLGLKE
jgi:ketosteroid isomerase-like protein